MNLLKVAFFILCAVSCFASQTIWTVIFTRVDTEFHAAVLETDTVRMISPIFKSNGDVSYLDSNYIRQQRFNSDGWMYRIVSKMELF